MKRLVTPKFLLIALLAVYLLAVLPFVDRHPIVEIAQVSIAAPAAKLLSEGVYGNDLYRGFYRTEEVNFEYMPLYSLLLAGSFRLLGLGLVQARLVSILAGMAVLLLTYALGRKLADEWTGLLAAAALVLLPISIPQHGQGSLYPSAFPLIDLARVIRFDVLVPVFTLAALLVLVRPGRRITPSVAFLSGMLAGFATLTHLYGAFMLPVLFVLLLYREGWQSLRKPGPYMLVAGWVLALLPWIIYAGTNWLDYRGQMLRHSGRFDLFDPYFYLGNLLGEPWRYLRIFGAFRQPILFPRPAFWLVLAGLVIGSVLAAGRLRRHKDFRLLALFLPLPMLALEMGLLLNFKRYAYLAPLLPHAALLFAFGWQELWRWTRDKAPIYRWLIAGIFAAALLEGGIALFNNFQDARTTSTVADVVREIGPQVRPEERTVMLHAYWFELTSLDTYALDLAFVLAQPEITGNPNQGMAEALALISPDNIIVREELLKTYERDPTTSANAKVMGLWRAFDEYVQAHCSLKYQTPADRDYGTILLYTCEKPGAGRRSLILGPLADARLPPR